MEGAGGVLAQVIGHVGNVAAHGKHLAAVAGIVVGQVPGGDPLAGIGGPEFDAPVSEFAQQSAGDIKSRAQPVQCMAEDDIDRLALDMGEKLAHAGLRHEDDFADVLVSIGLYEGPAILLNEAVPVVELRFEAGMVMVSGRMACVEQNVPGQWSDLRSNWLSRGTW